MAFFKIRADDDILTSDATVVLNFVSFYGKNISKLNRILRRDKTFNRAYLDSCSGYTKSSNSSNSLQMTPTTPLAIIVRNRESLRFVINAGIHRESPVNSYNINDLIISMDAICKMVMSMPSVNIAIPVYKDTFGKLDTAKAFTVMYDKLKPYPANVTFYVATDKEAIKYNKIMTKLAK